VEFYVKVHKSMLLSSIWDEDDATRITWVTLLMLCDQTGYVGASITGIAHMARLSVEQAEAAMAVLMAPDAASRSKAHDGRRVVAWERGYLLVNYVALKDGDDETTRKVQGRAASRKHRSNKQDLEQQAQLAEAGASQPDQLIGKAIKSDQITESVPVQAPRGRGVEAPHDVREDVWVDWNKLRKSCRAPVTPTVLTMLRTEATKAGMSLEAVMQLCLLRGWRGFQAAWVQGTHRTQREPTGTARTAAQARPFITPDGTPTVGDLSTYMKKQGD
jgi:hypothetical protein